MKKLLIAFAALTALVSCQSLKEEWQPVFTFGDNEPAEFVPYTEATLPGFSGTFTTIHDLKALYKSKPLEVSGNVWIKGQVISSDVTGNVYRELYIQDETGGIDVKIGKSSLYSEFTLGQWVYVFCDGLTLGAYNGMPQLGLEKDQNSEYETSYIDLQELINRHVFRGEQAPALAATAVTEADIKAAINAGFSGELWGKLVKIDGLKYGASSTYKTDNYKRIFILLYVDQYKDKKSGDNRVFCSQKTYGVNTWAMSKAKFLEYLDGGNFDECKTNGNLGMNDAFTAFDKENTKTVKEMLRANAVAVTTSQYFHIGETPVQIRTSGYAKFADTEIDPAIIGDPNASNDADCAPISVTGILTIYNGAAQLTLVDEPSQSVIVK